MINKRLVLASSSPRRVALLKSLGLHFDIVPHTIEEYIPGDALPGELAMQLAYVKAEDVAKKEKNAIIIAADTVVLHGKDILGKPKDIRDAKRILSMLSNSDHDVVSGVCIMDTPSKRKVLRISRTQIKMKLISEEEIVAYIKSGEPMDKAGAYAIQGEGRKFVKHINGSLSNVVGLPLELVQEMLNDFTKN
ncbi:MAG TPA: Maf family protein [Candidatus Brocadiaceae bacterium]